MTTHHSPLTTPRSHPEADELLKRACEIEARLQVIESRLNETIRRATEQATAAGADLKIEQTQITRALKAYFATLTPEQLGDRKSVKLNFGTFGKRGGRDAVKLIRGDWTWDLVMLALKARGWLAYLRTTQEVNKAAVLAAPPEERAKLAQCGLRVEPGDTFYVEPDVKKLAEYSSSHAESGVLGGKREA